jgi:DNA/RNA endonuclease YhcR with UshA esterase domain
MFGQKKLMIFCLITSLSGLVIIYFAATNIQPAYVKLSEITPELIGRAVSTTGTISSKSSYSGHIFLTLSDYKAKIQVPLFSNYLNSLKSKGIYSNDFSVGGKISVTGLVDEYKNQLQIIPRGQDDIKILGSSYK